MKTIFKIVVIAITIINQIVIFANNFCKPFVNKSIKCNVNERNIDPLPIEKKISKSMADLINNNVSGCETGYYGINCSNTCTHCKNNSTCDIETGDCDKSGCALYGYRPPACNGKPMIYKD